MPLLTRPASHLAERGTAALPALVAPVAEVVLRADLPGLDRARSDEVVGFVGRRCRTLPSFVRLGVFVIAAGYRTVLRLPAGERIVRALAGRPLPLIGEYPRLIRSLAVAYIWETWPDTAVDGSRR